MSCWMTHKGSCIQESHVVQLPSLYLVRWALQGGRPADLAQSDNRGSYCHASEFQQHYPTRKRPPRTPKCAQVPLDVSGDNAHSPDGKQQRRGRRQEWQQPEKIPWEYDGCTQETCCHWPGKYIRRPLVRCRSQRCSCKQGCSC